MVESWIPILTPIATVISLAVLTTGTLQYILYFFQLWVAGWELVSRPPIDRENTLFDRYEDVLTPLTLIVPAFNEELSIVESVKSYLNLNHPRYQVVVVNDGSTDKTLELLEDFFELEPIGIELDTSLPYAEVNYTFYSKIDERLIVIDKENAGSKADAINAGIAACQTPYVCVVDADSVLEKDSLLRAMEPFMLDPDRVIAVGGTVRIVNGCKVRNGRVQDIKLPTNWWALFQTMEYLRAFLMARLGWSKIDALTLISGAFGVFRRNILIEIGGFNKDAIGEDFDLIIRLHRHMREKREPYRIDFVPDPVCWTEVPTRLRDLMSQRKRWQYGALQVFFENKDMLFNPRYGRVGTLGFGNSLVVDVISPIVEVLGYLTIPYFYWLGLISAEHVFAFISLVFILGVFISLGALILEEIELRRYERTKDLVILTLFAVLENFGYRQINNIFRVMGWWDYMRGNHVWGQMQRTGFQNDEALNPEA